MFKMGECTALLAFQVTMGECTALLAFPVMMFRMGECTALLVFQVRMFKMGECSAIQLFQGVTRHYKEIMFWETMKVLSASQCNLPDMCKLRAIYIPHSR